MGLNISTTTAERKGAKANGQRGKVEDGRWKIEDRGWRWREYGR
jgi:hypothetical protein